MAGFGQRSRQELRGDGTAVIPVPDLSQATKDRSAARSRFKGSNDRFEDRACSAGITRSEMRFGGGDPAAIPPDGVLARGQPDRLLAKVRRSVWSAPGGGPMCCLVQRGCHDSIGTFCPQRKVTGALIRIVDQGRQSPV
jgi:hypothetical protein